MGRPSEPGEGMAGGPTGRRKNSHERAQDRRAPPNRCSGSAHISWPLFGLTLSETESKRSGGAVGRRKGVKMGREQRGREGELQAGRTSPRLWFSPLFHCPGDWEGIRARWLSILVSHWELLGKRPRRWSWSRSRWPAGTVLAAISQSLAWIPRSVNRLACMETSDLGQLVLVIFDEMKSRNERLAHLDKWVVRLSSVKQDSTSSTMWPPRSVIQRIWLFRKLPRGTSLRLVGECVRQHLKRRVKRFVPPCHPLREGFGAAGHSIRRVTRLEPLSKYQRMFIWLICQIGNDFIRLVDGRLTGGWESGGKVAPIGQLSGVKGS